MQLPLTSPRLGIPLETMHKDFRGEVVYNAETDVHFPNMTVGQTLTFAAKARTPRTRLPGVTREQWATHMKDVIMTVFGLSHTENTKVGNDFIRGVSGGERKRVSIAEIALSGSPLQCWDNSTRGLDSATALEFVKTVRLSTRYQGATAIVAIYQASQDIYDVSLLVPMKCYGAHIYMCQIFDKVTVLYEGRQIYFGRIHDAKNFFVDMGFKCPDRQTSADFLTVSASFQTSNICSHPVLFKSLTNPAERQARPGFEHLVPQTPDEFAKAWKESDARKKLLQDIEEFDREFPVGGQQLEKFRTARAAQQAKGMRTKSPYTISSVSACFPR